MISQPVKIRTREDGAMVAVVELTWGDLLTLTERPELLTQTKCQHREATNLLDRLAVAFRAVDEATR